MEVDEPKNVRIFSDCLLLPPINVGGLGGTVVDGVVTERRSTSDGLSSCDGVLSCLNNDGRDGRPNPDDLLDVRREVFIVSSAVSNF